MTTIRIHSFTSTAAVPNDGTEDCDFRGEKFIGAAEGDHHHTLFEKDVDESDPLVAETLAVGPTFNRWLGKLEAGIVAGIHLGGEVPRLRAGVWDKIAPR